MISSSWAHPSLAYTNGQSGSVASATTNVCRRPASTLVSCAAGAGTCSQQESLLSQPCYPTAPPPPPEPDDATTAHCHDAADDPGATATGQCCQVWQARAGLPAWRKQSCPGGGHDRAGGPARPPHTAGTDACDATKWGDGAMRRALHAASAVPEPDVALDPCRLATRPAACAEAHSDAAAFSQASADGCHAVQAPRSRSPSPWLYSTPTLQKQCPARAGWPRRATRPSGLLLLLHQRSGT